MNALIIATGDESIPETLGERPPRFLLPLVDKPFLQHVVEFVIESGADVIDMVLNHMPERVETLLGDGTRWGVRIRYHLVRDPARPYGVLTRRLGDGPIILAHGDCLPLARIRNQPTSSLPVAFCSSGNWTGWAVLNHANIGSVEADWNREQLSQYVIQSATIRGSVEDCDITLGVRTEAELIESQRIALSKQFTGLMFAGREVQEGVWIARNVTLHPTANVVPPVYIGENSRIGSGTMLGPNAVIVRDCVLDSGTTVKDSVILPGSYVGQALELDHVIVDRNRLINIRAGGEAIVRDGFILSGITQTSFRSALGSLLSRMVGLIFLLLTVPILLLTALSLRLFRRGSVLRRFEAVRLPAEENQWEWKTFSLVTFAAPDARPSAMSHFLLIFIPGLINVLRGHLRLVGVAPRSAEEVLALPHDWRILYLRARAGLITEAFAIHGAEPTSDEVYSCEAFYSVTAGLWHDARLLCRYFARMFQARPGPSSPTLGEVNLDSK